MSYKRLLWAVSALVAAQPAYASCRISTPTSQSLTISVVNGKASGTPQVLSFQGACNDAGGYFVAVAATKAQDPASTASGYDNTIQFSVTATTGTVSATVTPNSTTTPLKVVSAAQTAPIAGTGTQPITVTVTPTVGNKLVSGPYSGQISVSICVAQAGC